MNEKESLSMIDCGIKSLKDIPLKVNLVSINLHSNLLAQIENLAFLQNLMHLDLSSNKINEINGLNSLVSLKTLNLSCNLIKTIENLDGLKHLKWLNLSFNRIQYTQGLNDLWGADYAIETILLHSNLISSLEEINYYLSGLKHIKHLTLYENKFLNNIDYRAYILNNVKSLLSIDGKDRANKTVKYDIKLLMEPVLDEYKEFIEWSSIDEKKDMAKYDELIGKNYPLLNKNTKKTTKPKQNEEERLGMPKLDLIEDKIHKLLVLRDAMRDRRDSSSDESVGSSSSSCKKKPNLDVNKSKKKLVGILKQDKENLDTTSRDEPADIENKSNKNLIEMLSIMHAQINSHKQSQEANVKLIAELKANLESVSEEKSKCLAEKNEEVRRANEKCDGLSKEIDELKKYIEKLQHKNFDLEAQTTNLTKKEEKIKENLEQIKKQIKKFYQAEMEKEKKSSELVLNQQNLKLESLEKSYKSLEDEFRAALIIESNRYNELHAKHNAANQEHAELKNSLIAAEQNDRRNKALILELNELIKEQKIRLNSLSKMRKESTDDVQKRNEKLSEAVADCVRLKANIEQLKREKKEMEANFKKFAVEYEEIRLDKESWNKKLADQKHFMMQDNSRLDIENRNLKSEVEIVRNHLNKELDDNKIKSKIIEDQTETVKKLKNALIERDDLLRKSREESLNAQKSLEKQLNEEMDASNELRIKLDKAIERKEGLKQELDELTQAYDELKAAHIELSEKWKAKSELISGLQSEVLKMKEKYEAKEKDLVEEKNKLVEENQKLNERLRKIDDEFRLQYDVEKREHLKIIEKIKHEYEQKLAQSGNRIREIEEEMRLILTESANKKKIYEDKIKSFSLMFSKIQTDLQVD